MFQRIVFAAAISGLLAGIVVSAVQAVRVVPLIYQAEKYEKKELAPIHARSYEENKASDFSRVALTVISNVITAIGFSLLLIAGFSVHGGIDWKKGILWGIGGFVAFSLAPSIGLHPELPGTFAAPLQNRQIWWSATAIGTVIGLILLAFKSGTSWKMLAVVIIALPHIIGAPHPEKSGGLAPPELMNAFVVAALVSSAIFWMVLGVCSGYFFNWFEKKPIEA